MTFAQLCTAGWQAPKVDAGNPRANYKIETSAARYANAVLTLATDRPSKIRAAHRRYLRKRGLPLSPLPVSAKYRAKKAR